MTNRRSTPAKAPTTDATEQAAETMSAAAGEPVLISLREHPFVLAAIGLANAVAAVARFPNQPVPASLVTRIDIAAEALQQAAGDIDQGFFTPALTELVTGDGDALDVNWIRETFDSLNVALKERFDAVDTAAAEREKALAERLTAMDGAIAAIARAPLDGQAPMTPGADEV